jgi:hypothetical protein
VQRYELLRCRALGGDAAGWRSGLAVLQRHGVAGWLRAWQNVPAPPAPSGRGHPAVLGDRVVDLLAAMALGCVAAGG